VFYDSGVFRLSFRHWGGWAGSFVILSEAEPSRRTPSVYSGLRLWDPSSYRRHTVPYFAQDDTWESFQTLLPCHSDQRGGILRLLSHSDTPPSSNNCLRQRFLHFATAPVRH
jgi:hypothetical protein